MAVVIVGVLSAGCSAIEDFSPFHVVESDLSGSTDAAPVDLAAVPDLVTPFDIATSQDLSTPTDVATPQDIAQLRDVAMPPEMPLHDFAASDFVRAPDLLVPPTDQTPLLDLSPQRDLAPPPDLVVPPDLAPSIPATGQLLWLSADVGTPGSGQISLWTDRSPSANNATQTTTAAQPLLVTNAINGRSAVRFDGVATCLTLPSGFSDFTQGLSGFVVGNVTLDEPNGRFVELQTTGGCDNQIGFGMPSSTLDFRFFVVNGQNCNAPTVDALGAVQISVPALYEVVQTSSGTVVIYKNGQSLTTAGTSVAANLTRTSNSIGCDLGNSPIHFLHGDVAEILIYNRQLSTQERNTVESYLVTKYGL